MKQKETVQSIYEDAVFALWMDHIAEEVQRKQIISMDAEGIPAEDLVKVAQNLPL